MALAQLWTADAVSFAVSFASWGLRGVQSGLRKYDLREKHGCLNLMVVPQTVLAVWGPRRLRVAFMLNVLDVSVCV